MSRPSKKTPFVASDEILKVLGSYQCLPISIVHEKILKVKGAKKHITSRERLSGLLRHLYKNNKIQRVGKGVYCSNNFKALL